jgi:sec-independent protein translocase protein TatB
MFEIGWTEILVIAIVMIVVVGPKDLPQMLRTMGRMTAKLRNMAGDFQRQFNEALKEAELDDVKKSVDSLRSLNPMTEIRKQLNPFEQAAADVRAGLESTMAPKPTPDPAAPPASEPQPAEPLKNGAIEMPDAAVAEAAPSVPEAVAPAASENSKPAEAAKPRASRASKVASAAPAKGRVAAKSPLKTPVKTKSDTAKPARKAAEKAKPAAAARKPAAAKSRTARAAK